MPQDDNQAVDEKKITKPKKPYRKPEFRYERVFETMALACGKTPGHGGSQCGPKRKMS
jgi:hypothetical protein